MNDKERFNTDDIAGSDAQRSPKDYPVAGGAGAARVRDVRPQEVRQEEAQRKAEGQRPAPETQPAEDLHAALFPEKDAADLRSRWENIQTGFVDEPRRAVEQADELVAQAMKRLAEVFSDERRRLESHWDKGGDISTEDLRVALRRYRSFIGRLLSV